MKYAHFQVVLVKLIYLFLSDNQLKFITLLPENLRYMEINNNQIIFILTSNARVLCDNKLLYNNDI